MREMVPTTETNRLDGMIAVVTGGSRGIGRATAFAMANRGADVAVLSRTVEASENVAAEIRAVSQQRTFAGGGDVCSWTDVERVVDEVTAALGPIDILVSSAGRLRTVSEIFLSGMEPMLDAHAARENACRGLAKTASEKVRCGELVRNYRALCGNTDDTMDVLNRLRPAGHRTLK